MVLTDALHRLDDDDVVVSLANGAERRELCGQQRVRRRQSVERTCAFLRDRPRPLRVVYGFVGCPPHRERHGILRGGATALEGDDCRRRMLSERELQRFVGVRDQRDRGMVRERRAKRVSQRVDSRGVVREEEGGPHRSANVLAHDRRRGEALGQMPAEVEVGVRRLVDAHRPGPKTSKIIEDRDVSAHRCAPAFRSRLARREPTSFG